MLVLIGKNEVVFKTEIGLVTIYMFFFCPNIIYIAFAI